MPENEKTSLYITLCTARNALKYATVSITVFDVPSAVPNPLNMSERPLSSYSCSHVQLPALALKKGLVRLLAILPGIRLRGGDTLIGSRASSSSMLGAVFLQQAGAV